MRICMTEFLNHTQLTFEYGSEKIQMIGKN